MAKLGRTDPLEVHPSIRLQAFTAIQHNKETFNEKTLR